MIYKKKRREKSRKSKRVSKMKIGKCILLIVLLLSIFALLSLSFTNYNIDIPYNELQVATPEGEIQLVFSVTADVRKYCGCNMNHFRGVCETIVYIGQGEFMVSPGDMDPLSKVYSTIKSYIGQDYTWYPVVGNHETESSTNMMWLRDYNANGNTLPNIVNTGPPGCEETTYSFDYGDAHFVILNEYYDGYSDCGTDGDIVDALYNWLINDLESNNKPVVFVFGHEPAYPQPDEESGRIRHQFDSLNAYPFNRDRFWKTLTDYGVVAYICAHTHNYSVVEIDGVWQVDSGHARGTASTGAKSTFIMFYLMVDRSVLYNTYRLNIDTGEYELTNTGELK